MSHPNRERANGHRRRARLPGSAHVNAPENMHAQTRVAHRTDSHERTPMPAARVGEVRMSRSPQPQPATPPRRRTDGTLRHDPRRLLAIGVSLLAASWLTIAIVSALNGWSGASARLLLLMAASFVAGGGAGLVWVGWHDAADR